MNKPIFTLSAASRVHKCPNSALLNRINSENDKASFGSAGHELLAIRALEGHEGQIAKHEEICAKWQLNEIENKTLAKTLRNFDWCPTNPWLVEGAVGIKLNGEAVEIAPHNAAPGNYTVEPGVLAAGTIDVAEIENNCLWVIDYKFGKDGYVPAIQKNKQLWDATIIAARLLVQKGVHIETVRPAIAFVDKDTQGGIWETYEEPVRVDSPEYERHERELFDLLKKFSDLNCDIELQNYRTGAHCEYCPAAHACPAFGKALQLHLAYTETNSTDESLVRFLVEEVLPILDRTTKMVRTVTRAYVETHGSIELSCGRNYGFVEEPREEWKPTPQALELLQEELGELWTSAIEIGKTNAKEARKALARQRGEKIGRSVLELEEKLRNIGAVETVTVRRLTKSGE